MSFRLRTGIEHKPERNVANFENPFFEFEIGNPYRLAKHFLKLLQLAKVSKAFPTPYSCCKTLFLLWNFQNPSRRPPYNRGSNLMLKSVFARFQNTSWIATSRPPRPPFQVVFLHSKNNSTRTNNTTTTKTNHISNNKPRTAPTRDGKSEPNVKGIGVKELGIYSSFF